MKTFDAFGLSQTLLQALQDLQFVEPTPIQEQTIGFLLHSDQDLVGLAQTGTGKTAAYSLPMLHQIDVANKKVQGMILCPTRELCLQIGRDIGQFAKYLKGFKVACIYGGTSIDRQIKTLRKGCHVIVGTPGRTLDLIRRKRLDLQWVKWLVLDEADEMLNMGFQEDLNAILANTPEQKQTLLFSATMPAGIASIAQKYMRDPIEISVGTKNAGAVNVSHEYYFSAPRDRYGTLKNILDSISNIYAIVFCRTRKETKDVAGKLTKQGYSADALHGELSQAQRDKVMRKFRNREIKIMVATDVAARGLDVDDLTHVINFNLPDELEAYIHRSGRTGRAGQRGKSLAIIHKREQGKIGRLEKKLGKKFSPGVLPTKEELAKKHLFKYIAHLEQTEINTDVLAPLLPEMLKKLDWLSKEETIAKLLTIQLKERGITSLQDHATTKKLGKKRTADGKKKRHNKRESLNHDHLNHDVIAYSRFYMNVGSKKKLNPKSLISLLNEQLRGDSFAIGKIEIFKSFSFFEVDADYQHQVLKAFHKAKFRGEKLKVELAQPKKYG